MSLLEELAQKHYITLELGVQSLHDPTLEWFKRAGDRKGGFQGHFSYAAKVTARGGLNGGSANLGKFVGKVFTLAGQLDEA